MSPEPLGTKPGPTSNNLIRSRKPRSGPSLALAVRASIRRTRHIRRANGLEPRSHLQTPLLAQYAVSHYLEQDRVLDADVVD